jgi:FixJ family two-component response regulator
MLKDFDSDIEIIVLSGSDDVDIAASATHFGAISFVKKGEDDFKKIVNNIVWAIHEKAKIRKKAETQGMIKNLSIGIAAFTILAFGIYFIYMYLDSKK